MEKSLWIRCNKCGKILYKQDIIDNYNVCPSCNFHYRLTALQRANYLLDKDSWKVVDEEISPIDPLGFKDSKPYKERLKENKNRTSLSEAVINIVGAIEGIPVVMSIMDFNFIGGSMGSVVGERITRAIERAAHERKPLIIISCSGGARMQEGVLSLMQLAKTSAALSKLDELKIPFISVLCDPTTGGVTASFAMLGDINIAEPNALIGFAGPRVIEQTIREKLPKDFQKSEFLLKHGLLDEVVPRKNLRQFLIKALRLFLNQPK